MSNESPTKQLSVGVWSIIIASLVLSSAAIMLHLTKVMDHLVDRSSRYGTDAYQVQMQLNQTKAELAKLQADIASASNFNQLKQSMGMPVTGPSTPTLGASSNVARANTPIDAVAILGQSQVNSSFDEYQEVHPKANRKLLEELKQSNRELHLAYRALAAEVEGTLAQDVVMPILDENEHRRLIRLLFASTRRYDVLEVTNQPGNKATLKVRAVTSQGQAGADEVKVSSDIIQLEAVQEGTLWRVSDSYEAQAHQKVLLTKLKEQTKQVQALQQQVLDGKIKTAEQFQKAWDALPMIKK
ncbi:MAG TPA: hypothetical protein PLN21_11860 [Gemmatales bacterium]|nr:hypothetical protein [Gemmatales bacterium]